MADVIDKELAKRVGMNITNLLILNGKTQKEMCDHFKWGYSTVSSWCNGTRLPRMDKVDKMPAVGVEPTSEGRNSTILSQIQHLWLTSWLTRA